MTTDPMKSLKIVKQTDGCVVCALYAFCDNTTENSSSRFTLPRYLDYFHSVCISLQMGLNNIQGKKPNTICKLKTRRPFAHTCTVVLQNCAVSKCSETSKFRTLLDNVRILANSR